MKILVFKIDLNCFVCVKDGELLVFDEGDQLIQRVPVNDENWKWCVKQIRANYDVCKYIEWSEEIEKIRQQKKLLRICYQNESILKFVQSFAVKYKKGATLTEYKKLQLLIEKLNWKFTVEELQFLVTEENKRQIIEDCKHKILLRNPIGKREICETYLDLYGSDYDEETLNGLAQVLKDKQFDCSNLDELRSELISIEREIELKKFEKSLFEEKQPIQLEDIDQLDGYEFEGFLKNLYLKMGYEVEPTRLSGDQGADLVVVKFGEKTVIQAKCYSGKIGNKAVQEIVASMSLYNAHKGAVVTNNYFTPAAFELAEANNIELIDRDSLEELIRKYW